VIGNLDPLGAVKGERDIAGKFQGTILRNEIYRENGSRV